MTLVSLPSPIQFPGICGNISNTPAVANATALTAAGHYQAYVFCAREDMTISHVAFRIGSAMGSNGVDVRIETVATTGIPSTTLWATNTNGAQTVAGNTNYLTALTASASITKGQIFCVKLAYSSGTSFTPQSLNSIASPYNSDLPYAVLNTGSDVKSTLPSTAVIGLGSNSTTFYQVPGAIPPVAYAAGAFNNTSSAKRGLRFTPPMNCRAIGLRWYNSGANGDYNAVLYNDAGTELSSSSTAFDGNHSTEIVTGTETVYFDNTVSLSAGTTYRIAIEPSSATNVNVSTQTLATVDYRGGTPAKLTAHYTTFATATWDDTNTSVLPLMDLIIDQVDDGAGTGGVIGVIGG
jgi:hypothetical protein